VHWGRRRDEGEEQNRTLQNGEEGFCA